MALSATQVSTISTMQSGGIMSVPVDSRTGQVYRPTLQGPAGSPLSTFERYFDFFIDNVPDPDTALAMNPAFDELMRQQPDAHAAFLIREQTVAQYDWTINPADGDGIPGFDVALAAQVANYAKSVFNGLDMTALHEDMQQAISLGGAGHEFIWQPGFDGVERPKRFIYIHKSNYVFDRLGNQALLTRGTPVWGSYSSANTSQPPAPVKFADGRYASYFPDGKFIYHRYQALGGSWTRPAEAGYQYWGRGEDTRIYILVTAAQAVLRFWLKFLERWGIPPTDVYFPDNLRPSAEVQAIVSDAINGATNAIPRQIGQPYDSMYHIETRNPPGGSNEYFFTFLDRYVAPKIRMIILGSADEQQNSGASGGYSDHVSRKESGSGVVFRRDGLRISETLNRQLVPHIVLRKFRGLPAMYWPKHSLLAEEERDRKQEIEIAQILSSLVPIKEDEVYERSGFTKPEEGDKIVFNKQGPGMDDPFAAAMAGGEPPEGLRGPGPANEGRTPNAATGQGDDAGGGAIAQGGGDFSAFAADSENDKQGRWVTIGAEKGDDEKNHGGTPAFIKEGGEVVKGPKALIGHNVDNLPRRPSIGNPAGTEGQSEMEKRVELKGDEGTSARLKMLEQSLKKKEDAFDSKLNSHIDDVKSANGQPLNDKSNGSNTQRRWERQNDALRNLKEGAEKTRQAIEREKIKIANVENAKTPEFLQKMVDSGELNQWRKFPNRFFVKGVDKGRIVWNEKTGIVTHDYLSDVPKEHFPAFRDAFNKAAAGARAMKSQIAATGQGDAGGGAIAQGGGTPPPSQANTDDSGRPFAPATTYTVTRKDTGEHVGEHAWDSTILPKYNRDKVNIERTQDYLGRKNAEVNNPQAGPRMGGDFASRGSVGERGNSMQANFSAGFDEAEHPRGGKDNPGQFAPKGSSSESAKPSKPIPREHAEDIASDVNISINNARHQAIKVASAYRSKFGAAKKRIIGEIKSDIARVKALAAAQVEPAMEAIRSGQDEEMSSDEIRAELEEVAPDLIAAIDRNYPDQDWQSFNPKNLKGEDGYAAAIYEDENWPDGIEDASDSDAHAEAIESVPESLQQHFDPSYDDAEIEQNVARELLKPQIDELFDTYDEHLTGNEKLRNAAYEAFDKDEDLDPGAFRAKYGATFAAYIESDHPRGQPDNPGQFAPKGGSSGVGAPAKAREAYAKIREAIAAKKKEQQSARKAKLSEFKASAKDQAKKFVDTFNRDRSAAVACVTAYEAEVERLLESSPESEVPTDPKALTAWTVEKEKQAEAIVWSKFPQFKGIEPTHGELGEFITKKVKAELSPEMQEAIDAMLGTLDTDTAAKMADLADSIYYAVDDFKDSLPDDGDQAIDDALNDDAIPPEIAAAYDPELTEAEQVKAFEDALAEDDDTESDDE